MTPGYAKTRQELPWLYYPEADRVIINAHNFGGGEPLYPTLQDAVAGYFPRLDGGAEMDDQFGVNHGSLSNGATRVDSSGLAYSTDGVNDYGSIPFAVFPGAYPFAISLWFRVPNVTTSFYLLSIADINSLNAYFSLVAAGAIAGDPVIAAVGDSTTTSFAASTAGFSANTWTHALAVFESSTSRSVYLNGENGATETTSRTPNLSSLDNISVGALRRSSVLYSQILVDDILLFDRILTAQERIDLASQRGAAYA
jgi:hypothetical protein